MLAVPLLALHAALTEMLEMVLATLETMDMLMRARFLPLWEPVFVTRISVAAT